MTERREERGGRTQSAAQFAHTMTTFFRMFFWGILVIIGVFFLLPIAKATRTAPVSGDQVHVVPERTLHREFSFSDSVRSGNASVVILPVEGIIQGSLYNLDASRESGPLPYSNTVLRVQRQLEMAAQEDDLTAVVLYINSPGGTYAASDAIYNLLMRWRMEHPNILLLAYFGNIAASGGYYIGQAAEMIYAGEHTITGSIGVIRSALNYASAMEKLGLHMEVFTSGDFKDSGSPYRAMRDDERAYYQANINKAYQDFLGVVERGRAAKMTPEQVRSAADGRVFYGSEARELGLVDQLGTFPDALEYLAEIISAEMRAEKVSFVLYQNVRKRTPLDLKKLMPTAENPLESLLRQLPSGEPLCLWMEGVTSASSTF